MEYFDAFDNEKGGHNFALSAVNKTSRLIFGYLTRHTSYSVEKNKLDQCQAC